MSSSTSIQDPLILRRIGRPLRRSNIPDQNGAHPWYEYRYEDVNDTPFMSYRTVSNTALVDEFGAVTTYPAELALRYKFQNPATGRFNVLYVRDPELRWTEIIAGVRSGVIPARYVPEIDENGIVHGPMNDTWFKLICSQFTVSADNKLMCQGFEVCDDREDFEWKVNCMLPSMMNEDFLAFQHPEGLNFGQPSLIDDFNYPPRSASINPLFPTTSSSDHAGFRYPSSILGLSISPSIFTRPPTPPPPYVADYYSHLFDSVLPVHHVSFDEDVLMISEESVHADSEDEI
ncbi:hypothetical protein EV360DRAFT_89726 [Lentinula raphanica]|nr:hypothetical protein EV360DRAFT_89726 [Lentinula raphanica]